MLDLIFSNADYANVGSAGGLRGSSPQGVFYISLHTADPGDTGTQATSETAYTNYVRVSVSRASSSWTAAAGVCDNDNAITFAQCGASGATLTYFTIGSASSGAGNAFLNGALTAQLIVSNLVTPSFAAGTLDITLT